MHVYFHDNHVPKMASGTFLCNYSSLLKLTYYTMHEGETDFSVSMRAMTSNSLGYFLYNYFFTFQHWHTPY